MPQPVVSDWQGCSFKGIDLSRFVTDWKDTRQFALAPHRYWHRDGADIEVLGRKPHQAKVTLAFVGTTWRKDWLPIAASLDDDPSGPLVHPVYGQMAAVCEGFAEAAMNVEVAANLYVVPLSFVEDQVDTDLTTQASDPKVAAAAAQTHGAALLQRAPQQGPVADNVLRYVTTALDYVNAVLAAGSTALSYGRTLDARVDAVETTAVAAHGAIAAGGGVRRYDLYALVEQLFDDCARLTVATSSSAAPALVPYRVPSKTHIAVLAVRLYGGAGVSRIGEILANNAGSIPNPAAIEAGTLLRVAPPTVTR